MKSYTVDFESFEVEANTYEDAKRIATNQAWDNHGMRLDDDLIQEGEQKTDAEHLYNEDGTINPNKQRWTAVFNSLYIDASNEDVAWRKAERYAKKHNLDIIEMDSGYEL